MKQLITLLNKLNALDLEETKDIDVRIYVDDKVYIFDTDSTQIFEGNSSDAIQFLKNLYNEHKNLVSITLNDEYTAEVKLDRVVVGCQEISFDAVSRLYGAIQKVKNS